MTPEMQRTLDIIREHIERVGHAPTIRQITAAEGLASHNGTYRRVQRLIELGHLVREKSGERNIRLPGTNLAAVPTRALQIELARRERSAGETNLPETNHASE